MPRPTSELGYADDRTQWHLATKANSVGRCYLRSPPLVPAFPRSVGWAAMDDASHERRVGTVVCGKWTLERLLGAGGMAAVYVGVHGKIGRREAIKILHPEIARRPEL